MVLRLVPCGMKFADELALALDTVFGGAQLVGIAGCNVIA